MMFVEMRVFELSHFFFPFEGFVFLVFDGFELTLLYLFNSSGH